MTADVGKLRELSEESLARVRAGPNERYDSRPGGEAVDPAELADVLRRFVRQIVDEALTARGIR